MLDSQWRRHRIAPWRCHKHFAIPYRFARQQRSLVVALERGKRVFYFLKRDQHRLLILLRQFLLPGGDIFQISRKPAAGKDRRQYVACQGIRQAGHEVVCAGTCHEALARLSEMECDDVKVLNNEKTTP